jgi:DNA-binding HxlR family transcriptional regulator
VPEEVRRAANLLERRWLLSILYAAWSGANRFNEFRDAVGAIPPGTLAARLSELEEAGVLLRVVVDGRPPWVEYRLTPEGKRLTVVVDALRRLAGLPA